MPEIPQPPLKEVVPVELLEAVGMPEPLETQYWEQRPRIKKLYRTVGSWHGIGRMRKGGTIDNLAQILEKGELSPRVDYWDSEAAETISLTRIRFYAGTYADVHLQKNKDDLQYRDRRGKQFMRRFGSLYLKTPSSIASIIRHGPSLYRNSKQHGKIWMESKVGEPIEDKEVLRHARRWTRLRTTMSGDYPILIGIKMGAYDKKPIAKHLDVAEERTDKPIPLDEVSHIEVPLNHLAETEALLHQHNQEIPVIAREFTERYQSEFSIRELLTGGGFAEAEYPLPKEKISLDELKKYVPKKEWFTSPSRAEGIYHGMDHLLRVLVLQETLTNLLIESGQIQSEQIDRDALRWSAMAHDIRRHSDFRARGHATEAANWVFQILPRGIAQNTKDKIYRIVNAHDSALPKNSDIETELAILKDADKLERVRLERNLPAVFTPDFIRRKIGLNPERLHFDISRQLIPMANELYRLSTYHEAVRVENPDQAVFAATQKMGISE